MVALAQALAQVAVCLCAIVTGFKLEDDQFHTRGESVSKAARHEDGRMCGPSRQVSDGRGDYAGEIVEGKRHGKGTLFYRNGDRYEGEWAKDKKNGKGTMFFKNGDKYVGEWAEGKKSGTGTMFFKNGEKYVGEWAEGEMHGKGTFFYRRGNKYEGEWAEGKRHGKGTYLDWSGGKYEGEWAKDKKNGKGMSFFSNGNIYTGEWAEGKQNGTGTMFFKDGGRYEGEWAEDEMHGKGTYSNRNGGSCMGEWAKSKRHGKGISSYRDGSVQVAGWKYGEVVRDQNLLFSECSLLLGGDRASLVHLADYTDLELKPKEGQPFQPITNSPYSDAYKYVLFLHTSREGDHNGAYGFNNILCARIRCWAKRGFDVVLRHANSVEHATEVFGRFPDRSLDHVVIGGHGSCTSVRFGSNTININRPSESTWRFIKALGEKTRFDASVTLHSCNTAGQRCLPDKLNVFQVLAGYLPGRRVLGATDQISGGMNGERIFQPDPQEVGMDSSDDADTCLTGDRAIFHSEKKGDAAYAIAPRGQPLCSDLSRNDFARIKVCKTRCGGDCLNVRLLDGGRARLQQAEGVPDDRENVCRERSEKRAICSTTLADRAALTGTPMTTPLETTLTSK